MKKILAFLALALLVLSCSLFEVEEEEKNQVVPSLPTAIDSSIPNIINSSCTITNDGVIGESIFATFTASLTSGVAFSGEDEQKRVLTGKLTSGKIYIERNDTGQIFSANLSVQNSFSTDEGDYTVGFVKDKGIVSISTAEGTIAGRLVAATGLSCQVSYTRDADGNIITSKPTTDPSPDPKKLLVKTPTVSLTEKGTALADGSLIQTTQVYVEVSELKEGSIVALYTDPQANTRAPGIGSDKIVKKGEQSLSFQVSGLARNTSYRFYAQVTSDSASAVSQGSALISIDKNALDPPSPPTLPGTDSFVAHSPLVSLKENGTALADGSLIQTTQVYVEVSELKEGYIVALYTDPQARTRAPGIGSDKIVKKGEQSLSFQVSGLARSASYRFYAQVTADSASAVSQGSALISIDKNALDPPQPPTLPGTDSFVAHSPLVRLKENGAALADGSLIQTTQVYVEVSELKEGYIVALYTDPQARTRAPGIGSDKIVKEGEQSLSFQVSSLVRSASYRFYAQVTSDSASAVSQGSALISIDKNALDPPQPPTPPGTDSFVAHSPLVSLKKNGTALADGSLIQTTQVYVEVSELKEGYIVALYTDPQARTRAPGIGSDKIVKEGEQSLSFQVSSLVRSASYRFYAQITTDSGSAISQGSALISIDKNALDPPPIVSLAENGDALADGSIIHITRVYVQVNNLKEGYKVGLYSDPQTTKRVTKTDQDRTVAAGETSLSFEVNNLQPAEKYRFYAQVTTEEGSAVSQGSALIEVSKDAKAPIPDKLRKFAASTPLVSLEKDGKKLAYDSSIDITRVYVKVSELEAGYKVGLYTDSQATERAPGIDEDHLVEKGKEYVSFEVNNLQPAESYRFYAKATIAEGSAVNQGSARINVSRGAQPPIPDELKEFAASAPIVSLAENGDALADGSIIHITRVYVQVNNLKEGYKVGLYSDPQATKRVTKTDQDHTVAEGETSLSFEVSNLQPSQKYRFYAKATIVEKGSAVNQGSALISVDKNALDPPPIVSLTENGDALADGSTIHITRVYVQVNNLKEGYKVGLYSDPQTTKRVTKTDQDRTVAAGETSLSFEVNNLQRSRSYRFYAQVTTDSGSTVSQGSALISIDNNALDPPPIVSLTENGDALADGSTIHITRVYVQVNELKEGYKVGLYSDPQATRRVTKIDQDRPVAAGETSLSFEVNNLQPSEKYRFYAQVTTEEGSAVSQGSALIEVSKDAKKPIPDKLRKFAASTPLVSLEKDGEKLAYGSSIDITRVYVKVSELEAGYKVGLYTDFQATERAPGIDEDHLVEKGKEYVSFEVNNLQPTEPYRFYAKATIAEGSAVNQGSALINISRGAQPPIPDELQEFAASRPLISLEENSIALTDGSSIQATDGVASVYVKVQELQEDYEVGLYTDPQASKRVSGFDADLTVPTGQNFLNFEVNNLQEGQSYRFYAKATIVGKGSAVNQGSALIGIGDVTTDPTWPDLCGDNPQKCSIPDPYGSKIDPRDDKKERDKNLFILEPPTPYSQSSRQKIAAEWPWEGVRLDGENFKKLEDSINRKPIGKDAAFLIAQKERKGVIPESLNTSLSKRRTLKNSASYRNTTVTTSYYKKHDVDAYYLQEDKKVPSRYQTSTTKDLYYVVEEQEQEYGNQRVKDIILAIVRNPDADEDSLAEKVLSIMQEQVFSFKFSVLYWSLWHYDANVLFGAINGFTGADFFDEKNNLILQQVNQTIFYNWKNKSKEERLFILRSYMIRFAEQLTPLLKYSDMNSHTIGLASTAALREDVVYNSEKLIRYFPRYSPQEFRLQEIELKDFFTRREHDPSDGGVVINIDGDSYLRANEKDLNNSISLKDALDAGSYQIKNDIFGMIVYTKKKWHRRRHDASWLTFEPYSASLPYAQYKYIPDGYTVGYIGGEGYTLKKFDGKWYFSYGNTKLIKISNPLNTLQMINNEFPYMYLKEWRSDSVWRPSTYSLEKSSKSGIFIKGIVSVNSYRDENGEIVLERDMQIINIVQGRKWAIGSRYTGVYKNSVHQYSKMRQCFSANNEFPLDILDRNLTTGDFNIKKKTNRSNYYYSSQEKFEYLLSWKCK